MEYILIIMMAVAIIQLQYIITKKPGSRKLAGGAKPVFIDTSVLMDGRVLTAARTGFIPERLVILKSVVAELQLLADQADTDKRTRARHGLDVISALREMGNIRVEIHDDGDLDGGVDERLVEIAKRTQGVICTIDFNLNKVAKANGLEVLNVNELAQSIRMAFLPGETVSISLQQKGQDSHQAVGYLADGTMVVVERAAKHLGQTVEVEFIRSLQTAAGRMMFAKLAHDTESEGEKKGQASKKAVGKAQETVKQAKGRKPVRRTGKNDSDNAKPGRQEPSNGTAMPTQSEKPVARPHRQQNRRRKKTGEDSLMELVNSQSSDD